MDQTTSTRIENDPNYQKLVSERKSSAGRSRSSRWSCITATSQSSRSLPSLIAAQARSGRSRSASFSAWRSSSASILLTGIYVLRANSRYDDLTAAIVAANKRGGKVMSALHSLGARSPSIDARACPGAARASRSRRGERSSPTNWNAHHHSSLAFVALSRSASPIGRRSAPAPTKDFYAAGGGITGLQNGLAIAGDYMSAASFLGIVALVYQLRLLRPDLFDRLSRRLAVHHVPDGRAVAQSRPVHLRRRRVLSPSGDADSRHGGDRHAGRRSRSI